MKRTFLFLALLLIGVLTYAQEAVTITVSNEDISQNLDLRVVAQLFGKAETTENFEMMLNNPDSIYSNLDLNGDGEIDYLRVVETGSEKSRLILIQAVIAKDIYQDVASIYVEKNEQQEISVQIIGDEYIYGTNYIIEPVYIRRPLIYNWFWSTRYYYWRSPWYWDYYPRWWHSHYCHSHMWYHDRCYRFHHHHHICSFRYGQYPRNGYHSMHSGVSRRDYTVRRPENSFSHRNNGFKNATEFRRNASSVRNSSYGYRTVKPVNSRGGVYQQRNVNVGNRYTQTRSSNNVGYHQFHNRDNTYSNSQRRGSGSCNTHQLRYGGNTNQGRSSSNYGGSRTHGGGHRSSSSVAPSRSSGGSHRR